LKKCQKSKGEDKYGSKILGIFGGREDDDNGIFPEAAQQSRFGQSEFSETR
jgi:hypothetical protein